MTEKRSTRPLKIFISLLVLFALVGGGIFYYLQCRTPDYILTFGDSKGMGEGAGVFMAGVEVGRVVSVDPSGMGVAVGIKIGRERWPHFTEASRFFIEGQGEAGRVLVKNLSSGADPLPPGRVVEGTDSALRWSTYDFARGVNDFFESEGARDAHEAMRSLVDDFDRQLRETDWGALGKEMEEQMEELSEAMEEALSDEQVEELRQELKRSIDDALDALDRARKSPEAEKLREAVEEFLRGLKEGGPPQEPAVEKISI